MYRRVLISIPRRSLVRLNSNKRVIDLLEANLKQDEVNTEKPELLDDLSTFGSVLKASSPHLEGEEELDPNKELSRLIEDISLDSAVTRQRPRTSVHDSEIFNRLFETITKQTETKRNSKISDFLVNDISRLENVNLSMLQRYSEVEESKVDTTDQYKESKIMKLKVVNALKPVFEIVNRIETNRELLNYINKDIITKFNTDSQNSKLNEGKPVGELIKDLTNMDPHKPILNKVTLPVLMEFFIKTLVKNFNSAEEAISLFHSLKDSPLLYLRSCNVDIYNLLLTITWNNNKNIEDVKTIIKDMLLNGFPGDLKTIKVLSEIKLEVMKNLDSNDKDLFINKFEKYRYHYLVDIERRMKQLTRNN